MKKYHTLKLLNNQPENDTEIDILKDYEQHSTDQITSYKIFIVFTSLYIVFNLFDSFLYITDFSFTQKPFSWIGLCVLVLLPAIGLILFISKIKLGWFISFLYFGLLSVAIILGLIYNIYMERDFNAGFKENWNIYLELIISTANFFVLLFKKLLIRQFNLSAVALRLIIVIYVLLSVCIFFAIFESV